MDKHIFQRKETVLVVRIVETANCEIRFEVQDNPTILDLTEVLPLDGEEIIFAFPLFEMHSYIKHQKSLNYVQSPKKIVFNDGIIINSRNELSYKKLWNRLNFSCRDRFSVKKADANKFEYIERLS